MKKNKFNRSIYFVDYEEALTQILFFMNLIANSKQGNDKLTHIGLTQEKIKFYSFGTGFLHFKHTVASADNTHPHFGHSLILGASCSS